MVKVEILSGNLAGSVTEMSKTEAEVAVAFGYGRLVDGPPSPSSPGPEGKSKKGKGQKAAIE